MKLFLYSLAFTFSDNQNRALCELTGKTAEDIRMVYIDNAADIIPNSDSWRKDVLHIMSTHGYRIEHLDLRDYKENNLKLNEKLSTADIIWVGGGNTFYLRWLLRITGADKYIVDAVKNGAIYAGWSAGAIVAGPTLSGYEQMEDMTGVPEVIHEGMELTSCAVVPHIDNPDFANAARLTEQTLKSNGIDVYPLTDTQALVINGDAIRIVK